MNFLDLLKQKHDVLIAMVMVSIIGIMFLPLPSYVLDLLLTLSISLSRYPNVLYLYRFIKASSESERPASNE